MADSTTDVGAGYRLMEKDEPVLEGDEMDVTGTWEKSSNYIVGKQGRGIRYRRPVSAAAPAASTPPAPHVTPDVGGWRTRANGEIIQKGDDVRKVAGGVVVVDWEPATILIGWYVGTCGWQARYRIPAPEPEMTTARWCGMNATERREQQRPAIEAWLDGEKIEGLWSDEVWRDQDSLTSRRPLRIKPEAPKLVWSSSADGAGNTTWRTTGDGVHFTVAQAYRVSQKLMGNSIRWVVSHAISGFDSAEEAKTACQEHYEKESAR